MNKKVKSFILLGSIWIMVIIGFVTYGDFLKDKPSIDKQRQEQGNNLSLDQAVSGIKDFINTTSDNMKGASVITGGK